MKFPFVTGFQLNNSTANKKLIDPYLCGARREYMQNGD